MVRRRAGEAGVWMSRNLAADEPPFPRFWRLGGRPGPYPPSLCSSGSSAGPSFPRPLRRGRHREGRSARIGPPWPRGRPGGRRRVLPLLATMPGSPPTLSPDRDPRHPGQDGPRYPLSAGPILRGVSRNRPLVGDRGMPHPRTAPPTLRVSPLVLRRLLAVVASFSAWPSDLLPYPDGQPLQEQLLRTPDPNPHWMWTSDRPEAPEELVQVEAVIHLA